MMSLKATDVEMRWAINRFLSSSDPACCDIKSNDFIEKWNVRDLFYQETSVTRLFV